jgi:hypothetical protein
MPLDDISFLCRFIVVDIEVCWCYMYAITYSFSAITYIEGITMNLVSSCKGEKPLNETAYSPEERQAPVGSVERRQWVMRLAAKSTIINHDET